MEKLYLNIKDKIPFNNKLVTINNNKIEIIDDDLLKYDVILLNSKEYKVYLDIRRSKIVLKSIYDFNDNKFHYLIFKHNLKTNNHIEFLNDVLNINLDLFHDFESKMNLSKNNITKFNLLCKILDSKFTYLEFRIREIELKPIKLDNDFIILSKYHIFLDSRMKLYDLQTALFKFIDKKIEYNQGLIIKDIFYYDLVNKKVEINFPLYLGTKSQLLMRYFLQYDQYEIYDYVKKELLKCSEFERKYFLFLVQYIYILNLEIESTLNFNINNYLSISLKLNKFFSFFKELFK